MVDEPEQGPAGVRRQRSPAAVASGTGAAAARMRARSAGESGWRVRVCWDRTGGPHTSRAASSADRRAAMAGLAGRAGTLPLSPGPAVLHPPPAPGFHGNYDPSPDVAGLCKFMSAAKT